jgi:hypothetical protein
MQRLEFANKKSTSKVNQQKIEQQKKQVEESGITLREVKGRALSTSRNVLRIQNSDTFYVQSERCDNTYYFIRYNFSGFEYCSCPDNSIRGQKCKHIFSIEYAIRLGTLQDIEHLPKNAVRYPQVITTKSYEEDEYDF